MFFTREDILKIQNALLKLSIKDSELPSAEPVTYDDTLSIVQDGKNKQIKIEDFFNQISLWKREDFINITDTYDEYNISLLEAINLVPTLQRKNGLVITFQDIEGNWKIYQFRGDITEFFEENKWFDLYDYRNNIIQSIVPDEEDLTASTPDKNGNSLVSLKDRVYNPTSFSGKGYKILRKNVQSVNIASTKITITEVPSSDGTLSFTINGKETQIAVSATTDNTTALVAQKVATALQDSMTEYDVSIDASLITLTRKSSGSITPSVFSASTTGVVCTITDSTKREFRNILMSNMINQPNTIYEIRYDFDLNGKILELPENCTLKFEGGSFNNGDLNVKYINVTIQGPSSFENVQIWVNNTNCRILDIDIINESKDGIYSNSDNGCSGLTIKNCKIVSKGGQCIRVIADNAVEHIQNITIEGCDLQFYRMGIELQSHVENSSYIENCIISNNKIKLFDPDSYLNGFGISLTGFGNNVLVEKNEISSCRLGIENPGFSGTRIINNVITGITKDTRILAFSNRNSDKAYISGNIFNIGNIYIDLGIGMFFINNNCYVNEVRFTKSSDCKIMGNNITSYGNAGIFFDNTGGSYIDNNYIYTSSDTGEALIYFYGKKSTNNKVLNCHFFKSKPGYGVLIENRNGATGNIIYSYINENSKSTYYPEFTTQFTTINNKITAIDTVYDTSSDYKPLDAQRIKNFYFYKNFAEEAVFSIRVPKTALGVNFMFHVFANYGNNNTNLGAYEFIINKIAYDAFNTGVNLKRIRNISNIRYEFNSDTDYCYFNVILVGTSGNRGLNLWVLEGTTNKDNVYINLEARTAVYTKEKDGDGTSEQRPSNIPNNYQYFDTTLGKPIWWTGTKWVDATGADV